MWESVLLNCVASTMLEFRSAKLWGLGPATKTFSRYTSAVQRTSWTRVEPRQTKSGFGLDLLGGKSESATAGSFDANEDIKQTRYSGMVLTFWKGFFMKCRESEGRIRSRRGPRGRNLGGNMKIASGSATGNSEATSHTLAVLSCLQAYEYQSTPYSTCRVLLPKPWLWGLAVGGVDRGRSVPFRLLIGRMKTSRSTCREDSEPGGSVAG